MKSLLSQKIFVNLPVKDLDNSINFFTQLGFTFDPRFTDKNAACIIIGKNIFVMLLTEKFFNSFTTKQICDSSKYTEVINSISVESKEKVDELVNKAFKAGAAKYREKDVMDFMYSWSFQDLDNHLWEVAYLDESKIPAAQSETKVKSTPKVKTKK